MKALNLTLLGALAGCTMALGQQSSVSLRVPVVQTSESAGTRPGEFMLVRDAAHSQFPQVVHLDYGGTAVPGQDYAALPNEVTIPAGAMSVTLFVEPLDDAIVEGDEIVVASLLDNAPTGNGSLAPERRRGHVVIQDNDDAPPPPAPPSLPPSGEQSLSVVMAGVVDPFAREPGQTPDEAVFVLKRFGGGTGPLEVRYVLEGMSRNGVDYQMLPGQVVFPAEQLMVYITLQPLADGVSEGLESVVLRVVDAATYEISPHENSSRAIIVDEDFSSAGNVCVALPDGSRYVRFGAASGVQWRLEASSDLVQWETLFRGQASHDLVHFVDEDQGPHARRLYRLVRE